MSWIHGVGWRVVLARDLFQDRVVMGVLPGGEGEEVDAAGGLPGAGVAVFASLVAGGVEGDFGA